MNWSLETHRSLFEAWNQASEDADINRAEPLFTGKFKETKTQILEAIASLALDGEEFQLLCKHDAWIGDFLGLNEFWLGKYPSREAISELSLFDSSVPQLGQKSWA